MIHPRRRARGRRHVPGVMNKLEKRYAGRLELLRRAGEVIWFEFESVKLKLAEKTFYTPDFLVMVRDGTMEFHETKGHWEDDAKVKIKVAAAKFPFVFVGVTLEKGSWVFESFSKLEAGKAGT